MTIAEVQKTTLDFLQELVHELHQSYNKYLAGEKIRYEVYLGEDNSEEDGGEMKVAGTFITENPIDIVALSYMGLMDDLNIRTSSYYWTCFRT